MDPAVPRVVLERARLAAHSEVTLDGEMDRYLRKVLRLGEGDPVLVLDGAGQVFHGALSADGLRIAEASAPDEAALAAAAPCPVEILQAVPKGNRFADVVRQATELGVWRLVPVITERTVRRPAGGEAAVGRWRKVAREASRQSRRLWVPEVEAPRRLGEALAGARGVTRVILHAGEGATGLRAILAAPPPGERSVSLAIGPEGGFTPAEVAAARSAGFLVAGLGPRVLRTETVALAACAVLQHAWGDLG